jgi:hypothetical protein
MPTQACRRRRGAIRRDGAHQMNDARPCLG